MILNLFSIFDPRTSLLYRLNWVFSLLIFFILPMNFWKLNSRFEFLFIILNNIIYKEFSIILKKNFYNLLFFLILIIFIIITNFLGLFPYVFTARRHISFSLTFSLLIWISIMIFGFVNNSEHIFAHMLPLGTPKVLIFFIILIESIRNIIRPLTLAIRLSANIIAGHLLLTLLGSTGPSLILIILVIILIVQILLMILEMAVAIIQSYVFTVLRTLYIKEVLYEKL